MGKKSNYNVAPLLCICVVLCLAISANAENILITTSHGEGSHYFVGKTIGKYLAKHGHNVTVLLSNAYAHRAENPQDSELNFIIFEHSVPPEAILARHATYTKMALNPIGPLLLYELMQDQSQGMYDDCDDLFFKNPDVMRRLEDADFSVVIFDQIWVCSLLLAMKLNTTAVLSSPMSIVPMIASITRNPLNLAYFPMSMTGFTHPMTFLERVINVVAYCGLWPMLNTMVAPIDEFRAKHKIRPEISGTMMELVGSYPDLFLTNFDFAVEYPTALGPNIIPMGGITATPAKPLPEDLEAFMQSSGEFGVIMFTLGTYVHQVGSDFIRPYAEALGRFPQKVIFQLRRELDFELASNIKTMPWLPQNDLLGHPKLRLFMFHGGNNGFYEAQYHGVPVVMTPLTGDAIDSGAHVVRLGIGEVVAKTNITTESLTTAMRKVLTNNSYSKNAKRQSALLRSRAMHPGDRAAFWVNHVIKHGGAHIKNQVVFELNFWQRNLIDVAAFLLAVAILVLVFICYVFKCLCRCCKRVCCQSKEKTE